jgi:hypothetical protein
MWGGGDQGEGQKSPVERLSTVNSECPVKSESSSSVITWHSLLTVVLLLTVDFCRLPQCRPQLVISLLRLTIGLFGSKLAPAGGTRARKPDLRPTSDVAKVELPRKREGPMHTKRIILGLALPLMAWSVASCKDSDSVALAPRTVVIAGGCIVAGSVDLDPVTLAKHQDIEWELSQNSVAKGFTIEQKGTTWPWKQGKKFKGGHGAMETAAGPASAMNPDPSGHHQYSVSFVCDSGTFTKIDPTIIIPK